MTKIRHVKRRVATVIPEMGLEDEPISPVSRDETVTNKKPNTIIKMAPRRFIFKEGAIQMAKTKRRDPPKTIFIERSCSVRRILEAARDPLAFKFASPAAKDL